MQSWSQSEIERWYLWVHPIHNHISITYATQATWEARVCAFIKKKLWLSHTQITKWEEWHASLMNAIIIIVIVIVIVLHSAAKVTNLLQFISDSCPVSYFHMIFTVFTQHIHDNCIWFSTALAWPGLALPRCETQLPLAYRLGMAPYRRQMWTRYSQTAFACLLSGRVRSAARSACSLRF